MFVMSSGLLSPESVVMEQTSGSPQTSFTPRGIGADLLRRTARRTAKASAIVRMATRRAMIAVGLGSHSYLRAIFSISLK